MGEFVRKPCVYQASPYSRGDAGINTRFQCEIWHKLWTDGIVTPIAPLWSHFQHILYPLPYDEWVSYDNEIIPKCDAMLRLNASYTPTGYFQSESSGADGEVALATAIGIPVFYQIDLLYEWSRTTWASRHSAQVQSVATTQTGTGTT